MTGDFWWGFWWGFGLATAACVAGVLYGQWVVLR